MPGKPAAIPASRATRNAISRVVALAMGERVEFALLATLMALPVLLWLVHYVA